MIAVIVIVAVVLLFAGILIAWTTTPTE